MNATPAQAAKVLHSNKVKKVAYKVSGGYFYKTASLKKRVHKSSKYFRTNFYTYEKATVQKKHGKKAVYYYIKNKSGKVKGWVWHGNLVKQPTYSRQKKDITAMRKIVQGMSAPVQSATLGLFYHMDYKHPYNDDDGIGGNGRTLSNVVFKVFINKNVDDDKDVQGALKIYRLFKGRFSANDNQFIKQQYYNLDDVLHHGRDESKYGAISDLLDSIEAPLETYH